MEKKLKSGEGKYFTEEKWDKVNEDNKKLIKDFIRRKASLSPESLKQYENALQIFFLWVYDDIDNIPMSDIDSLDYLDYQGWMIEQGLSASSIRFKRSAISSLCNYIETYLVSRSPEYKDFRHIVRGVENVQGQRVNKKEPLTIEELTLLRKTLKKQERWQQLAYVDLSYDTGARRAEIQQLEKEIADYEQNDNGSYTTHDVRCKGGGRDGDIRPLMFSPVAMKSLKKWLEVRGDDDCEYVFVYKSKDGKECNQISESTFNYWCTDIFTEIVGKRVHPHLFRSTRATHYVVDDGGDIEDAQDLLGHASSDTTQIYVVSEKNKRAGRMFMTKGQRDKLDEEEKKK